MNHTRSFLLLAALLAVTFGGAVCAPAQELDFKKLQERAGYGGEAPPLRWTDSETIASIFNISFTSEGAVRGANSLPGQAELSLPKASKIKITLKFTLGSRGVAALTLTSKDGKQRLRVHEDTRGMALSWRDRTVAEEAVKFRDLKTSPVDDDHRTLELVVDADAGRIDLTDGETTDVIKANDNGAPKIQVPFLRRVIASVEGDAVLRELKIEEQ